MSDMATYLALLRGINVGGKNIIKMTELKAAFENMGFTDVATYIQSGNVLFEAAENNRKNLTDRIEKELSEQFDFESRVVVVSHDELEQVVKGAPKGFGSAPAKYRYDVIYLKKPLTAAKAMDGITTRQGVDEAHEGRKVLYFSRLIAKASRSRLSRVVGLPIYQHMTIRNWNTTTKLLALMDARVKGV